MNYEFQRKERKQTNGVGGGGGPSNSYFPFSIVLNNMSVKCSCFVFFICIEFFGFISYGFMIMLALYCYIILNSLIN